MIIRCRACGHRIADGDEVRGTFRAFLHELGSTVLYSITKPHEVEKDSLEHVNCYQTEAD